MRVRPAAFFAARATLGPRTTAAVTGARAVEADDETDDPVLEDATGEALPSQGLLDGAIDGSFGNAIAEPQTGRPSTESGNQAQGQQVVQRRLPPVV